MTRRFSRRDVLAGAVFVAFGMAFALGARTYTVGTALQMGPGYFPLVLGGVLALLGLVIVAQGLVGVEGEGIVDEGEETGDEGEGIVDDGEEAGPIPWLRIALLVAAVVVFGLGARELGLVPALLITTFLSATAGYRTGVVAAAVIAVGLTILCVLIFVVLLQIRLPLFGSWLRM